jgi:hypothetical protein
MALYRSSCLTNDQRKRPAQLGISGPAKALRIVGGPIQQECKRNAEPSARKTPAVWGSAEANIRSAGQSTTMGKSDCKVAKDDGGKQTARRNTGERAGHNYNTIGAPGGVLIIASFELILLMLIDVRRRIECVQSTTQSASLPPRRATASGGRRNGTRAFVLFESLSRAACGTAKRMPVGMSCDNSRESCPFGWHSGGRN